VVFQQAHTELFMQSSSASEIARGTSKPSFTVSSAAKYASN
jgi:hypothetical protein